VKAVSGKHLCRVLERNGWDLQRINGSHHIYSKPGVSSILSVPVHGNRDLKTGTLRALVKAAGLTDHEL
jgi:predicted RNA binding protein YcfA (HicA-like mRNA interferase family)